MFLLLSSKNELVGTPIEAQLDSSVMRVVYMGYILRKELHI
jgi:hypothetical protein